MSRWDWNYPVSLSDYAALIRPTYYSKRMEEKPERLEKNRLAAECAKLDPSFERLLAEEGLSEDLAVWPGD